MSGRRPPLSRGQTFPIYTSSSLVDSTISSLASLNIHTQDPRSSSSQILNPPGVVVASDSHSQRQQQQQDTSYPTPPQSATPPVPAMSQTTTPQSPHHHLHHHASSSSYFPPFPSSSTSSSSSSSTRYRVPSVSSSPAVSPGISLTTTTRSVSHPPSPAGPVITYPRNINPALPGQHRQRSNVAMTIENTPSHYVLVAPLGDGFSADSITIAARKENILVIIADRWDQEQDCRNEWQVQFGRDSDMNKIHASFDDGVLKITVKRFASTLNRP